MREVFYRDHGEQSCIHFKRRKCVNGKRGSCVSSESNCGNPLLLQVKKTCTESDVSEPPNTRYGNEKQVLTACSLVVQQDTELSGRYIALCARDLLCKEWRTRLILSAFHSRRFSLSLRWWLASQLISIICAIMLNYDSRFTRKS